MARVSSLPESCIVRDDAEVMLAREDEGSLRPAGSCQSTHPTGVAIGGGIRIVSRAADRDQQGFLRQADLIDWETRAASAFVSRKSLLYEKRTSGFRSCTPESVTPPTNGSCAGARARPSRANIIAAKWPPAECAADDHVGGRCAMARPLVRDPIPISRRHSSTIFAIETAGQRS